MTDEANNKQIFCNADEWLEKAVDLIREFAGNQADDIPDALWACLRNRPANSTSAPVALGGEKGEAVAWRFRWHPEGDWHLTEKEPRGGDGTTKQPLFAAPVGKARMLTDEEADHITGMHNTGRSQGDSECAEAIQRKFCEVNGISLAISSGDGGRNG